MKKMILGLVLFPVFASAHIENGLWKGQTDDGQVCEMNVAKNYFENNMPHPLNERIEVTINGDTFALRHPPVISVDDKAAFFNHDMFESINATSKGAKALVVKMNHTAGSEGPTEYYVINHEYRADKREMSSCKSLRFVK